MDVISDVLKSIRLEGAVYTSAEFTAPWCVVSRFGLPFFAQRLAGHARVFFFHFIVDGTCQVKLSGRDDVLQAGAGIVRASDAHKEYMETLHKLGAPAAAMGVSLNALEGAE